MMSTDPKNAMQEPRQNENESKEETLAERSARLEAEARGQHAGHDAPPPAMAEEQTSQLQAELDAAKDQMIRALAEAENIRKRSVKEREDASKFAVTSFAKDMLDIADNLRRALEAIPADLLEGEPRMKSLIEGIEATERTLLRGFEKHGIRRINPMDEVFNPNFHEVMFEAPVPGKPAGAIIQVLETGYMLHDRLLRPARVGVVRDNGQTGGGSMHPGGHLNTEA